jgi:hypothetical protein
MRLVATVCLALLSVSAALAGGASPQLYGKTITVDWNQTFEQRAVGTQLFKQLQRRQLAIIYVGSSGRPFIRLRRVTKGEGGGPVTEQVGSSGKTDLGGAQTVEFNGQSLALTTVFQGAAMRIQVKFDAGFQGCSASVVTGKEGSASSYFTTMRTTTIEIQSVSNGAATCSVEEGNAFAR